MDEDAKNELRLNKAAEEAMGYCELAVEGIKRGDDWKPLARKALEALARVLGPEEQEPPHAD